MIRTADQAGQPAVWAIVAQVVAQPVLQAFLQPPSVGKTGVQVQHGSLHAPTTTLNPESRRSGALLTCRR